MIGLGLPPDPRSGEVPPDIDRWNWGAFWFGENSHAKQIFSLLSAWSCSLLCDGFSSQSEPDPCLCDFAARHAASGLSCVDRSFLSRRSSGPNREEQRSGARCGSRCLCDGADCYSQHTAARNLRYAEKRVGVFLPDSPSGDLVLLDVQCKQQTVEWPASRGRFLSMSTSAMGPKAGNAANWPAPKHEVRQRFQCDSVCPVVSRKIFRFLIFRKRAYLSPSRLEQRDVSANRHDT